MHRYGTRRAFLVLSASILLAEVAAGQPPGAPEIVVRMESNRAIVATPVPADAYGPNSQTTLIPASAFVPGASSYSYTNFFGETVTPSVDGQQRWHAALALPSGAVVTEVGLLVSDTDASADITAYFSSACFPVTETGPHGSGYYWTASSSGSAGDSVVTLTGSAVLIHGSSTCVVGGGEPFDGYLYYYVTAYLETTAHALSGAVVKWSRSVSSAPIAATFGDVPTSHPFFQFVEALAASGITVGCGGGNFCPNTPLTRGQMAVFLAKALGLHWPI